MYAVEYRSLGPKNVSDSNVNDTHDVINNEQEITPNDVGDNGDLITDGENNETLPLVVNDQSKLNELISEQQNDPTLANCMHQAKVKKGNYYFKSGALFHREKIADRTSG